MAISICIDFRERNRQETKLIRASRMGFMSGITPWRVLSMVRSILVGPSTTVNDFEAMYFRDAHRTVRPLARSPRVGEVCACTMLVAPSSLAC